jgi:hypothetical protein
MKKHQATLQLHRETLLALDDKALLELEAKAGGLNLTSVVMGCSVGTNPVFKHC